MNVNPVSNYSPIANATQSSSDALGKDEFLKLLVAQLQNQDPLSPMEGQEFAAQLAQFSNVELLTSIDSNLTEGMNIDLSLAQAMNNTMAATFIGREVTAIGNHVHLNKEEAAELNFNLKSYADELTVTIRDENGVVVREISKNGIDGGEQMVEWDGEDANGNALAEGNYTFEVTATDNDGNPIQAVEIMKGIVNSVSYENGVAVLIVDGLELPFADVMQIG